MEKKGFNMKGGLLNSERSWGEERGSYERSEERREKRKKVGATKILSHFLRCCFFWLLLSVCNYVYDVFLFFVASIYLVIKVVCLVCRVLVDLLGWLT